MQIPTETLRDPVALGQYLRNKRKGTGLSLATVAQKMEMCRPVLGHIEAGKRAVKADELQRLLALYNDSAAIDDAVVRSLYEAKKRVLRCVFARTPDMLLVHTLQAMQTPTQELERMAASILHLLIEEEKQ